MWVTLPVKNKKKDTFYANLERSRELSSEQKENMFNMFETTKVSLTAAPFKFLKANPDIPNKKQHRFQSISGNLLLIQLLKRQILSTISSPKRWKCGKKTLGSETWSDEDDEENTEANIWGICYDYPEVNSL